jgi:uncharacterized BrkB/YihY/UPF0761 family membrane protein
LIAVLFWFYYSSWIILFGAQFTHLYADRYGEPIKPGADDFSHLFLRQSHRRLSKILKYTKQLMV